MNARTNAMAAIGLAASVFGAVLFSADAPTKPGDVTDSRVGADATSGMNWLVGGRTFDEKQFSPLTQITDKNVASLGLAWALDIYSPMGLSVEPLVVDGVAYVSAPQSIVRAIDATSGKVLWTFDPRVRLDRMRNSWAARTNRGVAIWAGKVYVGTGDCRLVAIDAATGKRVWESTVCDPTQTGITGAPHAAKGKVFIGYNGSDTSVRGSVSAFDAATGKRTVAVLDRARRSVEALRIQGSGNGRENVVGRSRVAGWGRRRLGRDHVRPGHEFRRVRHRRRHAERAPWRFLRSQSERRPAVLRQH